MAVALLSPAAVPVVTGGGEEVVPLAEEGVVVAPAIMVDGREANAAAPVVNGGGGNVVPVPPIVVDGKEAAPAAEGGTVVAAAKGDTAAAVVVGANEAAHAPAAEGGVVVAAVADGVKGEAPVGIPVANGVKGEALLGIPASDGVKGEVAVAGVNAIAAAAEEEEDEEVEVKWLKHYSSLQSILTVGDGDFSFSLALATAFGSGDNLVATSLDTFEDLRRKYSKAESNIMELKRLGAAVLHGIDAKRMKDHTTQKLRRFDRIVFNFPHAGFKRKEHDMRMIKELVWGFFQNARHLLRPYGEIHVSHKIGDPYDRWCIEDLAYESSLIMIARVDFRKEDYPGYNQKRGDKAKCDQPFDLGASCTFMFTRDLTRLKKMHENRIDAFSSLGIQVQHGIPFHPRPLVPAYPQPHFPSQADTVHIPVHVELYPHGIAHRQQPGFPDNFSGIERDPYIHQRGAIRPVFSMPGPPLNVLPPLDGTPPQMSRITRSSFHEPQEQPWRQERYVMDPEVRDDYHHFAQECPRNLQEEYEMQRQVMPGGTSLRYVDFLENCFDGSVQRQEQLRRMIRQYGRY